MPISNLSVGGCAQSPSPGALLTLFYVSIGTHKSELYQSKRTDALTTLARFSENHCVGVLRMDVRFFRTIVAILRNTALLEDTIHCCVEEQVAIFLQILGHSDMNRRVRTVIRRSGAMVSKYFNKVLDDVLNIRHLFILPPSTETPRQIAGNQNWMPYFKDCIGAIDGTHIHARVSAELNGRFWCRKGYPSQNVLTACDFDMKFTYVLAGWEGSASDSRVLASALSLAKPILCPPGKYYLADAGYPCLAHFITPFRSPSYHLNEIRGRTP
ncbi:uncharacterized protein LOC143891130 [Tasmannia lanceolata]|uniref:uncharacterized protein LOC143891130 n=1 Tax=Tasmannia lanceolata TaxID=3420 RepID=UPI004064B7BD